MYLNPEPAQPELGDGANSPLIAVNNHLSDIRQSNLAGSRDQPSSGVKAVSKMISARFMVPDRAALDELVAQHLDIGCRPAIQVSEDGSIEVQVIGAASSIEAADKHGWLMYRHELPDMSAEVSIDNRFGPEQLSTVAEVLDGTYGYLNTDEVESVLRMLASSHPDVAELIALPYLTHEGRTVFGLRIGIDPTRPATLITGGHHAREWGSTDICVRFASDLLAAHAAGSGLSYGGAFYRASVVAAIMSTANVIVVPCVNPDGRAWDQEQKPDRPWRKNRRPNGDELKTIGVDPNRNYDLLWSLESFAPSARDGGRLGSDSPGDDLFHGNAPFSEAETQNVKWLLDNFETIGRLIDIHSFGKEVIYPWGHDTAQSKNQEMNFQNPSYDGQRGTSGGYGEYMSSGDRATHAREAGLLALGISAPRGERYQARQAVFLQGADEKTVSYPTSGTVTDYAFSRHIVDPSLPKVFGYTIEFGPDTGDDELSFHPRWSKMAPIVLDICSGIFALLEGAVTIKAFADPALRVKIDPRDLLKEYQLQFGPIIDQLMHDS